MDIQSTNSDLQRPRWILDEVYDAFGVERCRCNGQPLGILLLAIEHEAS